LLLKIKVLAVAVGLACVVSVGASRPSFAQQPEQAGDVEPLERPAISWRLENPFRFFIDPKDTQVHRDTFLALSDEEKASPVLNSERALASREPEGWAETMWDKTCWDPSKNRFNCPDNKPYINPTSHKVVIELKGADANVTCTWLTSPRATKRSRGQVIKKPCNEPVTIDVPYPKGAAVKVEIAGSEVAATDIKVKDILIAGMGDSFGSGEGNPDVAVRFSRERSVDYAAVEKQPQLTGYPARVGPWQKIGDSTFADKGARWNDTACRRSLYSQQMRAALQLAVEDPHRAVTFVGVACSGAEVTSGLFLRYKGNEWVPNPPDLSQISALSVAQCGSRQAAAKDYPEAYHMNGVVKELVGGLVLRRCNPTDARPIDLLFVSVGGNDIGFARLVANAVLADSSLVRSLGGWFGQVHGNEVSEQRLAAVDERYKALNRAVHSILHIPWQQSDRVILTAYPALALLDEGRKVCPDSSAGMDVFDEFALSQKAAADSSALADKLQRVMSQSAKSHQWSFADAHRKEFIGRGLCAGFTENAFSMADDLRMPRLVNGKWEPYNPADYQPYASRQRWFRTPNDAFMTANFHAAGNVLQKVLKLNTFSGFQVLLASTYSGAFHPNAEGHAAMADGVLLEARKVLKKYGQVTDAALVK
jgi:lysophospholipase L1-like esterase